MDIVMVFGSINMKEIITKYIDVAKEFIVDFYISNKYILDILK